MVNSVTLYLISFAKSGDSLLSCFLLFLRDTRFQSLLNKTIFFFQFLILILKILKVTELFMMSTKNL